MKLSSSFAGRRSRPVEVEVCGRRAMAYAASVGDANPLYFDDEREGGVIAPPMMAVSLTWRVASNFAEFWDVEDFPIEVLTRQVHYSEVLRWNRPLRPGERLTVTGEVAAIMPHRAGTHLVIRFDAAGTDGAPAFTEFIGGMLRGVRCDGEGQGARDVPQPPRASNGAAPVWTETVHIGALDPWIYDMCAEVPFPIHTSAVFARRVHLPGPIYQGTGTLAHAVRIVTEREARGDARRVSEVAGCFTGMVLPGTEIRVEALGREESEGQTAVYFQVLNQEGQRAIRDGCVRLAS